MKKKLTSSFTLCRVQVQVFMWCVWQIIKFTKIVWLCGVVLIYGNGLYFYGECVLKSYRNRLLCWFVQGTIMMC